MILSRKLKIKLINWNLCVSYILFQMLQVVEILWLRRLFWYAHDVKDMTRICMNQFDKAQYYTGQRTRLISTALPTIHSNETNVLPVLERNVPSSPSRPTTQEASTLFPVLTPKLNKLRILRTYGRTIDSGVLLSDLAIPLTDTDIPSSSSLLSLEDHVLYKMCLKQTSGN